MPVRPVIFTAAVNYDRVTLEPFINSWREHASEAELVVFAGSLAPATLQWLHECGATVQLAGMNSFSGGVGLRRALFHKAAAWGVRALASLLNLLSGGQDDRGHRLREAATHLAMQRYFLVREYLRAYAQRYSAVLLIDCRDAIFQRSPFPCRGLHVFAENEKVGTSHFGKRWFQLTYGYREWQREAAQPFLCSGVTWADTATMQLYLDCMCDQAARLVACTVGVDQALHNYIVHNGLVPATVHAFGEGGAINLMCAMDECMAATVNCWLLYTSMTVCRA